MRLITIFLLSITVLAAQPSSDPKERIRVVRDLPKLADEAIPRLAEYASDPAPEVRVEAVKMLNSIGGPRTLNALVRMSADSDPEVQIHAVDGLVSIFAPGYLRTGISRTTSRSGDTIKVKFNDPGDVVIDGYVVVPQEAMDAVIAVLKNSKSLESRANAARAAGILRARAALPTLAEALYSKDDQLMYESVVALQKIRDPEAGANLAFLVRDLNPKVQLAALRAAGILRANQAAPGIRTVIDGNPSTPVLRQAGESLAMIADPADRGIFLRFLTMKDGALRSSAAEGLARIKDPADADRLTQAFEAERDYGPRLAMAFALVSLGRMDINTFSPFRYLLEALNRPAFRSVSLAYLTELARETAPRLTLYANIPRGTKDEKIGICQVLGESGQQDSLQHLNALKDEKDPEVAQACLRSLRTLEARLK